MLVPLQSEKQLVQPPLQNQLRGPENVQYRTGEFSNGVVYTIVLNQVRIPLVIVITGCSGLLLPALLLQKEDLLPHYPLSAIITQLPSSIFFDGCLKRREIQLLLIHRWVSRHASHVPIGSYFIMLSGR